MRFEARWLEEDGCRDIIKNAWEAGGSLNNKVLGAVNGVMRELMTWNRNVLGDLEKRISRLKKELEVVRRRRVDEEQVRREEMLHFKLSRLEDQRELYWKQ